MRSAIYGEKRVLRLENLRFLFLAIALCFVFQGAARAQEEVIWLQGSGGPFSVADFGPSQKSGSAQYSLDSALADDININGTISRVDVGGYSSGPFSPTPSSAHYHGLMVKFYAVGADNKPGALQAEYFVSKNSPNFLYQSTGLNDLRVRLEPAFQANGRHFLSVQAVIDPVIIPGSGGSTAKWYWRSDNADVVRDEGFYFRESPSEAWGRDSFNHGNRNLSMRLWGTRVLVSAPVVSQISANTLPQAGRIIITGTNFGTTQGAGVVRINGAIAPVSRWTETSITAYVSDASTIGAGNVQVVTAGGASNNKPFTVTARPPANGRVRWRIQADAGSIFGRPAVAADGTVYAVDSQGHLYAVSPEGGVKWIFTRDIIAHQGVSVGADGTIYYTAGNEVYAVNPNGTLKWNIVNADGGEVAAGPNVGTDGNVYAVFDNAKTSGLSAVVISPDGQIIDNKSAYFEGEGGDFGIREIVFGAPGQYYFVLNNLNQNMSGFNFYALGGNFRFVRPRFYGQPAVATDGTIYAVDATSTLLSAIDPDDGSVIRTFGTRSAPDVGSDGNIYAIGDSNKVFSFNSSGGQRWQFQSFGILGEPIVSPNNDVVSVDTYTYAQPGVIQGINAANGQLAWQVNLPAENGGYVRALSRPRFSGDGATVYYGTNVNSYASDDYTYLYAIAASTDLPCSYGISPNAGSFPYNGGGGSITVSATSANCAWTTTSNDDWITILNSGSSGNGSATYTVAANPGFTARTGAITIAGQTFTVNQSPRTTTTSVNITYPSAEQEFTLPTNIFIGANSNNTNGTIARVEFYADSELIGTDTSAPYQVVWNDPSATEYTLVAKSIDENGVVTESAPVAINILPVPPPEPAPLPIPPPVLTKPTENQQFAVGDAITFAATPGTSNYPVERVEFYLDTTLIGSDETSPYEFTLNTIPPGIYSVSARTVAGTGAQATSQPIDIRVTADRIASGAKPFDFDGDGKSDISIFRPSNGEWWYLKSSNGGNAAFQFGNSADKLTPGDFTGDGKTDVAIWRPVSGEWFILRSEDGSYYSYPFGTNGDIPAVGDFDKDGKADSAIFRPSDTNWYIRRSSDGGTTIEQFGASGDVPVVADYDGDGKSDIAIWRASVGEWWIKKSSNNSVVTFQFGNGSDKPVQGDYTGDGKADVAIWRPNTGEWFILRSENSSYYSYPFGTVGDIASPGDYDGDGKFDATVFRPSGSTWYVQRSSSGVLIQNFGQSGDTPVPDAFVP